ncbi:MAG: NAD-dependent epimerase/dehydratase family protein [Pseudolysinimonas sp.]
MKVVITGGAGFIGTNLALHFNEVTPDVDVVLVDDYSNSAPQNTEGIRAEVVEASVLDTEAMRRAFSAASSIVHLGALGSVPRSVVDPRATHDANATGTLNVLQVARDLDIEHVVVSSSSSVYGSNLALPKSESDWTHPLSPYAVSKLATEAYTYAFANTYGMKTLPFRLFNVYGPRQSARHVYAAVVPMLIERILDGRPLEIHGDGEQSRDFTYVATVCATVHDAVMRRVSSSTPVNLAFGTNTTINQVVGELEAIAGRRFPVEHVGPRKGDVRASMADGRLVRELFPAVEPIPLAEGLAATWGWFAGEVSAT